LSEIGFPGQFPADADSGAGSLRADLVAGFNLQPKFVAVEVNCELVPRRNYDQIRLREGDHVEIVTLVGGG
jgi:sulfur carrier protein